MDEAREKIARWLFDFIREREDLPLCWKENRDYYLQEADDFIDDVLPGYRRIPDLKPLSDEEIELTLDLIDDATIGLDGRRLAKCKVMRDTPTGYKAYKETTPHDTAKEISQATLASIQKQIEECRG